MSDVELTASGRPKRTTRTRSLPYDSYLLAGLALGAKRKFTDDLEEDDSGDDDRTRYNEDPNRNMDYLLQNPKSVLAQVNISVRQLCYAWYDIFGLFICSLTGLPQS
jgi:hypothetical protein